MKSLLFIHRSVGRNLIKDGELRKLFAAHSINFSDYDQNIDTLTNNEGEKQPCNFQFPLDDTKPLSYAQIFTNTPDKSAEIIRDFALTHDVVVIKSCYPNNNIKSEKELETLKENYRLIATFFNQYPNKEFFILTSPPLAPMMTTKKSANYARSLADWLATTELGRNVHVFNFYSLLADEKTHCLKRQCRRLLPFDSHPNKKASAEIAPKFVEFLVSNIA